MLMIVGVFLSGCQSKTIPTKKEIKPTQPKPTSSQKPEKPKEDKVNLKIVSPKEGESVKGPTVALEVKIENFTLTEHGGPNNPREGHLHLFLEEEGGSIKSITSIQTVTQFSNVAPGKYTLTASLYQNDHSPFEPPLETSISFTVY